MFGTAVASTPFSLAGGKAAFGGIQRGARSGFDEDEEDEDDGRQKIELREGSISLDQVCPFSVRFVDDYFSITFILAGQTDCYAERVEKCTYLTSCLHLRFPGHILQFSLGSRGVKI